MSEERVPYRTSPEEEGFELDPNRELGKAFESAQFIEGEEASFFPIDDQGLRELLVVNQGKEGEGVFILAFPPRPLYLWEPKEDITAFELASCLPILLHSDSFALENLPPTCQRHFREEG